MNSVVCIAQVPDTETRIKIGGDGRHIDETGVKYIVSPYDEYALEAAIRLKEKEGGDVTVLGFGPDRVQQALRESLARGATRALHVKGESGDADSLGIAKVLAAAIKTLPHDLIFFGKQGVGTDNSLVGPMVAELLGYPQINVVTHLDAAGGKVTAHREIEGGGDHRSGDAGGDHGAEGVERASLRVAQGNHGGEEDRHRHQIDRGPRPFRVRRHQPARDRRVAGTAA